MKNMDKGLTVPKMSANTSAENTRIAPQNFGPFCLPKQNSLRFSKKNPSIWVSIVRRISYCTSAYALWEQQSIDTTMYAF